MIKKIFLLFIGLNLIIFVGVGIYNFKNQNKLEQKYEFVKQIRSYNPNNCEIKNEKFLIKGLSMKPLINNGDEVDLLLNYYNCGTNEIKSGDIVIFENNFEFDKIIKQIKIIPGDKVELNYGSGTILVNDKLIMNSQNKLYIFSKQELDFLNIYSKNGKMSEGNYYLLGDNISGSIDSRTWGPVSVQGILGKVNLLK